MTLEHTNFCSRCGTEPLRRWSELDREQQMLVERLPASAVYSLAERAAKHRFCPRCWHEETSEAPHTA